MKKNLMILLALALVGSALVVGCTPKDDTAATAGDTAGATAGDAGAEGE